MSELVLLGVRAVAFLVAVWITLTSYRAYARTDDRTFLVSTAGFAFVCLGLGVESFLLRAVTMGITTVHTIESVLFAVGLLLVSESLTGTLTR
ncbi:MAG: hypothetical protein ABEK02_03945 [Haloquadratum sp.]